MSLMDYIAAGHQAFEEAKAPPRLPLVVLPKDLVDLLEAENGHRLQVGDIIQDANGFGIARVAAIQADLPGSAA